MNTNVKANAKASSTPARKEDGISHINIYLLGKTPLGQMLAHFFRAPFKHPDLGPFDSLEGYWHWVKSKDRPDKLRYLSGFSAKRTGAETEKLSNVPDFQELILEGNYCKITQNEEILKLFAESTLPFEHYYMWKQEDPESEDNYPIRPRSMDWLIPQFELLRDMIRNGAVPPRLEGKVTPPTLPSP